MSRLGLIGIGNMGYYFAESLLNNDYDLIIYDKDENRTKLFKDNMRVTIANSSREVADKAEIVLVSLPKSEVIEDVVVGNNGLITGKKIRAYIDLSTTGKKESEKIAEMFYEKNVKVLDAPVSGGTDGAKDGSLTVMVSGNKETYQQMQKILNCLGKKIFYIGDKVGQGQVVKVLNNLLSAAALAITSEAVLVGERADIKKNLLIEIFNSSSGRNSATLDKFPKSILNESYDYGFKTGLMYKDVKLCIELAEELKIPMRLGTSVMQIWKDMIANGEEHNDITTIYKHLKQQ